MLQLPPLSLYVHLPWCIKKCPYCDFNSHQKQDELPETDYLKALMSDFVLDMSLVKGRSIQSIFFGGGTPSLLSGRFYQDLLSFIAGHLAFAPDIEITLEANPGASDLARFESYRKAGINRISVGVQSFSDANLKALGRVHSGDQAKSALRHLKAVGFENFNIDLMHGLPGQSPEAAVLDLTAALEFGPTHLSWYQLTIEPNTAFYSAPPVLPNTEKLWDIQTRGQEFLEQRGFAQYEVSAYSLPGKASKHNLNYWRFGDYIGIGAGAHSKVTSLEESSIMRYRKSRLPRDYMLPRPSYRVAEEQIETRDLPFEFLMNVLRLKCGVEENLFGFRTGLELSSLDPQLSDLRSEGLMEHNSIKLTSKGYGFINTVLERFID